MRREGLVVDSQTIWDQLATVAEVLRPTYEALGQYHVCVKVAASAH